MIVLLERRFERVRSTRFCNSELNLTKFWNFVEGDVQLFERTNLQKIKFRDEITIIPRGIFDGGNGGDANASRLVCCSKVNLTREVGVRYWPLPAEAAQPATIWLFYLTWPGHEATFAYVVNTPVPPVPPPLGLMLRSALDRSWYPRDTNRPHRASPLSLFSSSILISRNSIPSFRVSQFFCSIAKYNWKTFVQIDFATIFSSEERFFLKEKRKEEARRKFVTVRAALNVLFVSFARSVLSRRRDGGRGENRRVEVGAGESTGGAEGGKSVGWRGRRREAGGGKKWSESEKESDAG